MHLQAEGMMMLMMVLWLLMMAVKMLLMMMMITKMMMTVMGQFPRVHSGHESVQAGSALW